MSEKKLEKLALNKKVVSKLTQSVIKGGLLDPNTGLDDGVTTLYICTNHPNSGTCTYTGTKQCPIPPVTAGCNDQPSRACA